MTKKPTSPSRRSLIIGAPALLLARSEMVDAASRGSPNTWPGQPGNPVGYAAAPGYPGALTPSPWPPNGWGSGSADRPNVFKYLDFDAGSWGGDFPISIDGLDGHGPINYVTFLGCRFQANGCANLNSINTCVECYKSGSNNITFSYCSMVPRTAVVIAPPNAAWPASSVGTGVVWTGTAAQLTYQIPFLSGTEFAISVSAPAGGLVTIDRCDMWGMGDGVNFGYRSAGQINVTDCWIHDTKYDQYPPQPNNNDHTDGIGYLTGLAPPAKNILIRHNTIAGIGNTNGIGFQHMAPLWSLRTNYSQGAQVAGSDNNAYTSNINNNLGINPVGDRSGSWTLNGPNYYSNISVINNYLTGFNNVVDIGAVANPLANNNVVFTDNVFASDLMWGTRLLYHDYSRMFTGTTNVWRRNILQLYPASKLTYASAHAPYDGQFVLPVIVPGNVSGTFNRTDWQG